MSLCSFSETLKVQLESHNPHNSYAIAVKKRLLPGMLHNSVIGHLPREVSRFIHFIIIHGGRVSCKVRDAHHRRSPLIQRGLEIPAQVTVEMDISEKNVEVLKLYEEQNYKEPGNGVF